MPAWLIGILVNLALSIGVPALEKRFPKLAPLLEALLGAVHPSTPPSPAEVSALHQAAQRYEECTGTACGDNLKKD